MKKFISMVMAAAMVVSLVPATAFAAGDVVATAKVMDDIEWSEAEAEKAKGIIPSDKAPEVRFEIESAEYKNSNDKNEFTDADVVVTLDGAVFRDGKGNTLTEDADEDTVIDLDQFVTINGKKASEVQTIKVSYEVQSDNEIKFNFKGEFKEDYIVGINLPSELDDTDAGTTATVTVEAEDFGFELTDAVYAAVLEAGIKVTCKDLAEVAVEEETALEKDLKIEAVVGTFAKDQEIELKLSKGFEFVDAKFEDGDTYKVVEVDENEATIKVTVEGKDTITIEKEDMVIDAVTAKAGDICTITVKAEEDSKVVGSFDGKDAVEIVEVIADAVIVSVDEDEDVPVMWSGVGVESAYLNDDADHVSLEVTVEESVADAWDFKQAFDIELTEGVFVTAVDVTDRENVIAWGDKDEAVLSDTTLEAGFKQAYVDGDQEYFKFGRKTFDAKEGKKAEISFTLTLVAEPGFEGDVVLKMAEQEVTIATFKAPYTVEAAQNDLIIDYRYTEVPTDVVITEAETGLWVKDTFFGLAAEKMSMESDPEVAVNEESEMEIKADDFGFVVEEESDEEAAVVTINGIELYMSRDLAAGAYDLYLTGDMVDEYVNEDLLYAVDKDGKIVKDAEDKIGDVTNVVDVYTSEDAQGNDYVWGEYVVKEGFVNIVTAGRDADDASFTTKVVVPVGESYIVAGEQTVALDVPAYVSASGYTMLPVRAVAVALGILNNNVLWDQASKTVTILYGQRIITMTVGAKVINVNGSAIPASSSPEVVDGRTFLPMRDLATALGVTDITWAPETKTATLNGNK